MTPRFADALRQDTAFALRSFRRRPGFVVVAVITLGVGIGATTATYSVVDGVLLEAPSYRDPDGLVTIWHRFENAGAERVRVAAPDAAEYRDEAGAIESIAFIRRHEDRALDGDGADRHVRVGVTTPDLFEMLGVEAALGRTFLPDEGVRRGAADAGDVDPAPGPLVLGHAIWRSAFGADPGVLGRTVRLSGISWEIVGVLPEGFDLVLPPGSGIPSDVDAWTTLSTPLSEFRRASGLRDQDSDNTGVVLARLADGSSLEAARGELSVIAARQRDAHPPYRDAGLQVDVVSLHESLVGQARPVLLALMGAVVFVLLIACINVANLLIARASDRAPEMAVRTALGAGRGRLLRQGLTESGVLALAGAGVGSLAAVWGVDVLLAFAPEGLPVGSTAPNLRVLAVAVGAGVGAALIFGVVPSAIIARAGEDELRSAGARGGGGRRWRLRRVLAVSEVALSFVLLAGAGIMLRSAVNLADVDPGFEPEGLHTFTVTLPGGSIGGPGARAEYMARLEQAIRDQPDVTAVGLVGGLPLGGTVFRQPYGPAGSTPDDWSRNEANFRVITSEYLEAMGTRLIAGRTFTSVENTVERERIALVSAGLAARLAPEGNAVGRTIGFPLDGAPIFAAIVGVVEDVRYEDLRRPAAETIYVPYRQEASRTVSVAVRTRGDAAGLRSRIEEIAAGIPSDVPIPLYDFRDMGEYVGRSLAPTRFALALIAGFAAVALALSAVGLGGVLSYMVSRRTREFGLRIALGAPPRSLLVGVLGGGVALAGTGIVGGVVLATTTSSALRNIVFGVPGIDLVTYAAAGLTLLVATVLASWIPARRAAALEPLTALRAD